MGDMTEGILKAMSLREENDALAPRVAAASADLQECERHKQQWVEWCNEGERRFTTAETAARQYRAALEQIQVGAQSNAGHCADCDSIASLASAALAATASDADGAATLERSRAAVEYAEAALVRWDDAGHYMNCMTINAKECSECAPIVQGDERALAAYRALVARGRAKGLERDES